MVMTTDSIRFEDGAAYERLMGKWSQLAGAVFLDWLSPPANIRWLDVGCGNGVFTEMVIKRCAPAAIEGVDPSEAQIAFARTRPGAGMAQFRLGDAMALPYADDAFDAAVMALVIFFVPEPARGVAEMARVVRPGGTIAAYAWDIQGGGFPMRAMGAEFRALGVALPMPPSVDAAQLAALRNLWAGAGIEAIDTTEITVERTFADFDDYWTSHCMAPHIASRVAAMAPGDVELLKTRLRAGLPADASGRITYSARANAVKGRMPG